MTGEPGYGRFAVALWRHQSRTAVVPIGKQYSLDEAGELVKLRSRLSANELVVETFDDLSTFARMLDDPEYAGAMVTTGLPREWRRYADTTEWWAAGTREQVAVEPHKIARTNADLVHSPEIGSVFVVDFDTEWFRKRYPDRAMPKPNELWDVLVDAAAKVGLNLSEVDWLSYKSSSSALVRSKDDFSFDEGGTHLVFLVDSASALPMIAQALFDACVLEGWGWAGVSKSGKLLRRGIIDLSTARPTQPLFMLQADVSDELVVVRDVRFNEGHARFIDSTLLKPLSGRDVARTKEFWAKEKSHLQSPLSKARECWKIAQKNRVKQSNLGLGEAEVNRIVCAQDKDLLLGCALIAFDDFGTVSVEEVLASPQQYHEATCADPIEPDYGGGRNVGIVYANSGARCPILYTQAHGGQTFRLLHDFDSSRRQILNAPNDNLQSVLSNVLPLTYTEDDAELDQLLKEVSRVTGIGIRVMKSSYQAEMRYVRRHAQSTSEKQETASIEHRCAESFLSKHLVSYSDDGLWKFDRTHWHKLSDAEAESEMLRELSSFDTTGERRTVTRIVKEGVSSLKQQAYAKAPPYHARPSKTLNFLNGELRFQANGNYELVNHDPATGLTTKPVVEFRPRQRAPVFQKMLVDLFLPAASKMESLNQKLRREAVEQAQDMARHVEEVLAYALVPDRWMTVWFLLLGPGANGKSLLMKVLQQLMPYDAVISERLQVISKSTHGMARLIGKTLYIEDDLATNSLLPDDFLKQISEGKRLSADVKYCASDTSFYNRCAVFVLSNNNPRNVDISAGTLRRMHVIPFARRFYSKSELEAMSKNRRDVCIEDAADTSLYEKLVAELPGIYSVLVEAYSRLLARKDFQIPNPIEETTRRAFVQANPLPRFVEECCVVDASAVTPRTTLHASLDEWSRSERIGWSPSAQQIRSQLEHLGIGIKRKRVGEKVFEVYEGIEVWNRVGGLVS